jgi:hypothetical protein
MRDDICLPLGKLDGVQFADAADQLPNLVAVYLETCKNTKPTTTAEALLTDSCLIYKPPPSSVITH